jgi:hypothetical protein
MVSNGYGTVVQALTKNSYWFLSFSERPFDCYDISKFIFCLIKPPLSLKDLASRRSPIWYPVMSAVYTGRSLPPHTWYPERQLNRTLNAQNLLQLDSKVRGLAYRKHWRPERQSSHTGQFLLPYALNYLYY